VKVPGVAEISIFTDNAVVRTGNESLMELVQLPTMILTPATIKCVKIETKNERELRKFDKAEEIYFAEIMPEYLLYVNFSHLVIVGRVGHIPSDGIRLDGNRLFLIILVERWFVYWIISIMRFLEEY